MGYSNENPKKQKKGRWRLSGVIKIYILVMFIIMGVIPSTIIALIQ